MTPLEWIAAGLAAGTLLLAYRLVDGTLKDKAAQRRGLKVKSDLLVRVEKLERDLTRIPMDPVGADDFSALEDQLKKVAGRADSSLTQGTAEKIINAHNQLVQDVAALKEWQLALQQAEGLEEALLNPQPKKE